MIDSGDTTWMMVATSLVFLMTPGLAFFYGGLVRKKNVLSIMMQCFILICVLSLQWILLGYSLAFGADKGGLIGGLDWVGLRGVGTEPNPAFAATIPHLLFMAFQMMFAIITPALIVGAFAERIKFSGFLLFSVLWATFIYDPLCHWVWGGGWIGKMGALDFAGGTVVHISAGVAALVTALMIGKRRIAQARAPHNLAFVVLGGGLLWFGWFGFNAGSSLAANGLAVSAFVTTNTAAAAAGLAWALLDWLYHKVPTVLGVATGILAGLVAVTPAAGFVSPMSAIVIGVVSSAVCFLFVTRLKGYFGYDDSLDAFGVHGVGGIIGALLTGVFASTAVNPGGADGLLYGNPKLLGIQLAATVATILFAAVGTFVLFKLADLLVGVRVTSRAEDVGLDLTQHHEAGYTLVE